MLRKTPDPELPGALRPRVPRRPRSGSRTQPPRTIPRDKDGRETRWLKDAREKMAAGLSLTREERHLLQQEYRRRERGG